MTASKPLGFWSCWSLVVGCMIGSGVFMLPTVLAPYGLLSFGGFVMAAVGALALGLTFARLAARTSASGGNYLYVREAFGDLIGYVIGWSWWISWAIAIPVVAIAFVGYLTVLAPALAGSTIGQAASALALIWMLTFINVRGLKDASIVQIIMTVLKLAPLLAIIALGVAAGAPENLPAFNPTDAPILPTLAAVALIAFWPFTGFEAVTAPAGAVHDPTNTIPRALVAGMFAVALIYLVAVLAVMMLVPADTLEHSAAPFAEAARGLGAWGPPFIAIGALIATAGTLNGVIFCCGQIPMAVARDALAPAALAATNRGGAPYVSLLFSSAVGSALLLLNYSRGLVGAYTFLLMMATATALLPYLFAALAEIKHSWKSATGWASVALIGGGYALFALIGSGAEVLIWGGALTIAGVPLYFLSRRRTAAAAIPSP